jgi:hypothetical protein
MKQLSLVNALAGLFVLFVYLFVCLADTFSHCRNRLA